MNNITKALEDDVVLFLTDAIAYQKIIKQTLTNLQKKKGIYVAVNKPAMKLKKTLPNNIMFIDTTAQSKDTTNIMYCAPENLSGISIKIKKQLKKYDFVLFDTIDAFLTYNKKGPVERFLTSIINHISNQEKKAIDHQGVAKNRTSIRSIFC